MASLLIPRRMVSLSFTSGRVYISQSPCTAFFSSCLHGNSSCHLRRAVGSCKVFKTRSSRGSKTVGQSYVTAHIRTVSSLEQDRKKTAVDKNTRAQTADLSRLLSLAKPEKLKLAGAVCLLLTSSAVTMSVPFCMGKIIDIIYTASSNPEQMMQTLSNICKVLIAIFLVGGSANFGRVYLIQVSGQNIIKRLRKSLFSSILKQETAFFDQTKTGEVINRLSADTILVGKALTDNVSDGLRAVAQAAAGVSMMVYVSPKLAGVVLMIVPPVALGAVMYGRYVRSITKKVQDSLADATQVAEERIGNIRVVRAFGKETKEIELYNTEITNVLELSKKEALARAVFFGSNGLAGNMVVLAVLYSGGVMMTDSLITVGELTSFLLYTGFVGISVAGLSSFYSELMKGIGASSRVWQLIDRNPLIPVSGGLKPPVSELSKGIEFRNVTFSYPSRQDIKIFDNVTLYVPAGSVTAVVGPSGSGKSTLASLLLRLYDPTSGEVMVGGHDVRTLCPTWLRDKIGVVHQEPILFSCSIAENISYGSPMDETVTVDAIIDATKQANAYDFITGFPKSFDTVVGERGQMLSGGQRQRIAIARAIVKNPRILLLDEATSALDAESEFLVQEALERVMKGRTVITIAHRLSTIKNADNIVVLNEEKIAEAGSYQQLMERPNGLFKKLVERQTIVSQ